ncbi:MAG: sulfotransferase [Pseudomonadota bacterium]
MKFAPLRRKRVIRDAADAGVNAGAASAAASMRGDRPPAIMLFGVMPRAGTVHVGELLSLHPGVCAHPNDLWEVPFLECTDDLLSFTENFFRGYHQNTDRMGQDDFLAIFGGAFTHYLYSFADAAQTVLIKETSMKSFERFPVVFPVERLLLLMRDGRDLVSSTTRTWPKMKFGEVCERWAQSARTMLDFVASHDREDYWLVKFEDILDAPDQFVREACRRFDLDVDAYPFESQGDIEVIGSSTMSEAGSVDWSNHVAAPKGFRPTGHWEKWSAAQRREFVRIAGDELIRAGYAQDHDW